MTEIVLNDKAPSTIRYYSNFISIDDEQLLISQIQSSPIPKWTLLSNRRLQNYGGIVANNVLIADGKMPDWLDAVIDKVSTVDVFPQSNRPNHVLINEYLPGQGIMPHTDGPSFYPTISTISVGSHTLLDFFQLSDNHEQETTNIYQRTYIGSVLLERRSLIVIKDDAYKCLHGIESRHTDVITENVWNRQPNWNIGDVWERDATRYSLTIRNVPKTARCSIYQSGKKRTAV